MKFNTKEDKMGQLVSDVTQILDAKKSNKQANNSRLEILEQIAKDEQAKTNLVKKALASQRAKYGAAGINASSTSAGSVLKRLRDETEQPYNDKKQANLQKLKNIKTNKKTNLLKTLLSRFDDIVG